MSRYSKMQAPPFWMWMFRIVGIGCLVTLLTPTAYLIKYYCFDQPQEHKIAVTSTGQVIKGSGQPSINGVEMYIGDAEGKSPAPSRIVAVRYLGDLASNTSDQVFRPMECLHAKLALEQVASNDPDLDVREKAQSQLMRVAAKGAVIVR